MLLQCFFNASHCFFNAFQCFSMLFIAFSMIFNAFSMLFIAFSMLFNAFSMLSAAHATRLSFTMPQRRVAILRFVPAPGTACHRLWARWRAHGPKAILRCVPALPLVWARLACTWVQGNSQVVSSPGTACHGHAWARSPRRGAHLDAHPCARSPKRARTLPEPCSSTAGHALRRKTHSRMLRTRFHEVICDSTP